MRVLDLFSGIGGFSLGLERAGFKTVAFCEIDPYCQKVLRKHWPDVPIHEDITTLDYDQFIGQVEVITGGFPCQDISIAGRGAGLAGERSGLYRYLLDAICVVRPQYAIMENVAALLNRGMGTILGDLAKIGYGAEWHCIPASAIGAPHQRDRVWIIANDNGNGIWPEQVSQCRSSRANELATNGAQESMADTQDNRTGWRQQQQESSEGQRDVADTQRMRELQQEGSEQEQRRRLSDSGETIPNPDEQGLSQRNENGNCGTPGAGIITRSQLERVHATIGKEQWESEPSMGRVANGIPKRVDRLRGLGNAVVPQIPEILGRAINDYDEGHC